MASHDIRPMQEDGKPEIDIFEHDTKQEIAYIDHDIPVHPGVDAVAQQTLAEGQSPWKVILANPKLLALIMIVQSNAIIVGVEFSLPGNLLGIPVSCSSPLEALDPVVLICSLPIVVLQVDGLPFGWDRRLSSRSATPVHVGSKVGHVVTEYSRTLTSSSSGTP
jgi:hypothetical protein